MQTIKLDDEAGRLAALRRYEVLDTEPEKEFADILTLLRSIFGMRFAAVTMVDAAREWTKAAVGYAPAGDRPREQAYCNRTIAGRAPYVVEDALEQPAVQNTGAMVPTPAVRSYIGAPLTTPDGYNIGAVCVFDDKPHNFSDTDRMVLSNFAKVVMSQLELRLTAREDSLTGTRNRRAFMDQIERSLRPPPAPIATSALLVVDIDHFKRINDRYGHPAGDEALRVMAQTVQRHLDTAQSFGRLGGEEFGILLPATDAQSALDVAEAIRLAVANQPIAALEGAAITLSIGLAMSREGESAEAWMARADQALYAAKNGGRNRVVMAQGDGPSAT